MSARFRSEIPAGDGGFGQLLYAEWTKFRTVRGWVLGMLAAVLVTVLIGLLGSAGSRIVCRGPAGADGGSCGDRTPPLGPDGEPVSDGFFFAHQPLTGDGSITARVTSLTGLYQADGGDGQAPAEGVQPWSKTGLIVKDGTRPGSAYAAVMVTGEHGVRMQYNYTHDVAGIDGAVSGESPRWLRLVRSGETITGYDSVDGAQWHSIGTATLAGLPSTVDIGLFAASPEHTVTTQTFGGATSVGGPSQATGEFDNVVVQGGAPGTWAGTNRAEEGLLDAGYQQTGDRFTVTGSGDIAPGVAGDRGGIQRIENGLVGAFAGLIAVIVVATLFVTGEYRRGLIHTTFAASPRRGRVLAAKSVVAGSVAFVAGLVSAGVMVPLVAKVEQGNGFYVYPATLATELRVIVGTAALLAVAAVLAVAVGTALRRSAGAVAVVVVAIVLPYILAVASVLPAGAGEWLLRFTPAAGFAIQQSTPQYPQVLASYTPGQGYYPLSPWGGFAVLCGYAAIAVALAVVALRRRDA